VLAEGESPPPNLTAAVWVGYPESLREMRSGLRGFYVFITCIALGAMAIAGVGSLAASLADGLSRQGGSSGEYSFPS